MSYLLFLKGPDAGRQEPIERPRTVIGRDPDCHIVLTAADDGSSKPLVISRRHAVITRSDGTFFMQDGDGTGRQSRNRTLLNGKLVPADRPVRLRNDDVIQICDIELLFHDSSSEPEASSIDAAISHDSSSFLVAQPAEKLQRLLEITNRLSHSLELDRLLPDVVETLLQLFRQADRAFLILIDPASGSLVSRSRKTRRSDADPKPGFSTSIVEKCLKTVQALLSNDVPRQFADSESAAGLEIRSVMCAPLWAQGGKAVGVLLVDCQSDRRHFTQDDLNLLMGVAGQASIALSNAQFYRDSLARERLSRDLSLAREVVRTFLPSTEPNIPGYEFFACNQSALEVGGDYYDFVDLPGPRLGIVVGDVAGKGVPAALVMSRFSAEARACLRTAPDLATAVCQLNDLMQPISQTDRFVTLAALVLDPATHRLHVVNAGHPPPLLVCHATGELHEITPRDDAGPPLGVCDTYPYPVREVALEPGDTLVVFSDGVTEAMCARGRQLGTRGLRALLEPTATPKEMGERILQGVKDHAAGCSQQDDITLVCLGRTASVQ
jgi:serine phosphatase RsbU (regulator of sigma subunit)/pSer/pThr/pTyr-binding forkhead associated (FHA) protein